MFPEQPHTDRISLNRIGKESSHLLEMISIHKRKVSKKSSLKRIIILKKMEKRLKRSLNENQTNFENNTFRGRRFSYLQKYLKSMHKSSRYPLTMTDKNQKTNEDE